MKIIYVHRAERNREKGVLRQEQDITLNGIKDANLLGEKLKLQSIKAIYTSPYKRCIHTANIINCVTSGINLSAFVYDFTQKDASNDNPVIQGITCSPVLFSTDNSCF